MPHAHLDTMHPRAHGATVFTLRCLSINFEEMVWCERVSWNAHTRTFNLCALAAAPAVTVHAHVHAHFVHSLSTRHLLTSYSRTPSSQHASNEPCLPAMVRPDVSSRHGHVDGVENGTDSDRVQCTWRGVSSPSKTRRHSHLV
jgi:hypothetical protein